MSFGYIRWFKRCSPAFNILILKSLTFSSSSTPPETGWPGLEVVSVSSASSVVELDTTVGFLAVPPSRHAGFARTDNLWLVAEFSPFSRIFCTRKIKSVNCIFCYIKQEYIMRHLYDCKTKTILSKLISAEQVKCFEIATIYKSCQFNDIYMQSWFKKKPKSLHIMYVFDFQKYIHL